MKTVIRKMGNSDGVIIPKPLLAEIGVVTGDPVDIKAKKGSLLIKPVKHANLRKGWAEASKAIHEAGDDELVWPEFGNEADKDLKW
jgi:antitoxin MazE